MKKIFRLAKLGIICSLLMTIVLTGYRSFYLSSEQARLKYGSSGDSVVKVQEKLKELGLYDGECSGVYDVKTAEAIKKFQKYNGIKESGVCDKATLECLELTDAYSCSELEKETLARLIEAEAGGNTLQAMTSVGAVVMNRVRDGGYPSTVLEVIYSGGAFKSITDGSFLESEPSDMAFRAAEDALGGMDPTYGAMYVLHGSSDGKTVTLKCGELYFAK